MLVVMAVLFGRPDLAFAQYPGFSSDAEPASVSADANDAPSGGSGNASGAANSGARSSAMAGADSAASDNLFGDGYENSQTASNGLFVADKAAKIILCISFVSNLPRWNLSSAEPAWRFRAMKCRAILMNCALSLPRCEGQQTRQCKVLHMMFSILIPN